MYYALGCVVADVTVVAAVVTPEVSKLHLKGLASTPATLATTTPASSLELAPRAVNKRIKRALPVAVRRPLRIYAISARWLEALQARLYLRSIPRSLLATDYFRIIARQFDIPGALAATVSRPRALAVVKGPLLQVVRRTSTLVVDIVKDGGDIAGTVFVYNVNARLEKMLLATIRTSGIPRSLFATDHFRMIANQFAAPTVLTLFIGPLVRPLDARSVRAKAITYPRALPVATYSAPSLFIEAVEDNRGMLDTIVVYKVDARSEKTLVASVRISGVPSSLLATDYFAMIVKQFATPTVLESFTGPLPATPEVDVTLTAYIEEVEEDVFEPPQSPAEVSLGLSVDSSLEMNDSTLLDISLPADIMDCDVVKPEKTSTPAITPYLSASIISPALEALPFDLDSTLVEASTFIEEGDDGIIKGKWLPMTSPIASADLASSR